MAAHCAVSAGDGALDVAQHRVDPFEPRHLGRVEQFADAHWHMGGAGRCDAGKAAQAVGVDMRARVQGFLGQRLDGILGEALDAAQFELARLAFGGSGDGGHERLFARRAAPALTSRAFAAEIGVVHLDTADQALAGVVFALQHDLRQFALHRPGGGLAHSQPPPKFDRRDALFGLRHMIHGLEPDLEFELGVGEDGAGRQRGLAAAGVALVDGSGPDHAMRAAVAHRALETVRPAQPQHHRAA